MDSKITLRSTADILVIRKSQSTASTKEFFRLKTHSYFFFYNVRMKYKFKYIYRVFHSPNT